MNIKWKQKQKELLEPSKLRRTLLLGFPCILFYRMIFDTNLLICSGYMSPEYAMEGYFSFKSDVYSFGVIVLEIVSGKRNQGFFHSGHQLNLLGHVSIEKQPLS